MYSVRQQQRVSSNSHLASHIQRLSRRNIDDATVRSIPLWTKNNHNVSIQLLTSVSSCLLGSKYKIHFDAKLLYQIAAAFLEFKDLAIALQNSIWNWITVPNKAITKALQRLLSNRYYLFTLQPTGLTSWSCFRRGSQPKDGDHQTSDKQLSNV